ncbi:arylsulfotransferase family protein [Methylomonas methanica]|nr:arylsulfotransferase family protein [Methylomonas methanica]
MANKPLDMNGKIIESIATFPETINALLHGTYRSNESPSAKHLVIAKTQRFAGQSGFQFNYTKGKRPDLGYILLNRYDGNKLYSVSELWDLNTQEKVHTWHYADVDAIWKNSNLKTAHLNLAVDNEAEKFRGIHALLTENGDIFTHTNDSPIIKADAQSKLKLLQDEAIYHHSMETNHDGNIWVPKRIEPKTVDIGGPRFRDDGIALISPDGKVLFEKSVIQLLDENGLGYLIYGKGKGNEDPVHLNDIQPALNDGNFWKKGDIFLSLRNQSMIVLYRPSNNKVLWYKQGPWMHQHDVDILNNYQISVFNNNAALAEKNRWAVRGTNNVLVYDFITDSIHSPWQSAFEKLKLRTEIQGRDEIVGRELFVEETEYGRLVQFSPDGTVSWQFVNRANDGHIYLLNWSRLINREVGDHLRYKLQRSDSPDADRS